MRVCVALALQRGGQDRASDWAMTGRRPTP
jgi:hypothetical protein